jgi:hypothetical protein
MLTYWYVRPDNAGALSWVSGLEEHWKHGADDWEGVRGLSATVFHLRGEGRSDPRVRATELGDLERCVRLVNETHAGLDLFRPYTVEFLRRRLDDPFWGPKPPFWSSVYAWGDHFVLEDRGEIVACGGLWDQGRHQRERWRRHQRERWRRHQREPRRPHHGEARRRDESDGERVVDRAALMDFGCAGGCEGELADLVRHLAVRRTELGRTTLAAPLEFLPKVRERLADEALEPETRSLQSMPMAMPGIRVEARIERPYTDLAYW